MWDISKDQSNEQTFAAGLYIILWEGHSHSRGFDWTKIGAVQDESSMFLLHFSRQERL